MSHSAKEIYEQLVKLVDTVERRFDYTAYKLAELKLHVTALYALAFGTILWLMFG